MCTMIWLDPDNEEITTVGELKAVCPTVVPCSPDWKLRDGECLCSVDVEETAKANGFVCEEDSFTGDYRIRKDTP